MQPLNLQDAIAAWLSTQPAPAPEPTPDFRTVTTPADGLVDMAQPSQPKVDWRALALAAQGTVKAQAALDAAAEMQRLAQPTPWQNMGLRAVGGIGGGIIGSVGGPVGAAAGAALGSALMSNEVVQPREVQQGTREGVNPLVGYAEGAANMLPMSALRAGQPILGQLPRVAGSAAAGAGAGSVGVQLVETGTVDPMRTLQETALGTVLGTGIPVGVRGAQALPGAVRAAAQSPAVQRLAADESGAVGPNIRTAITQQPDAPPGGTLQLEPAPPATAPAPVDVPEVPTQAGEWTRIAGTNLGAAARGVLDDVPVPASMAPEGIYRLKENTERAFRFLDRHTGDDGLKQIAKDSFVRGEDAYFEAHRRMGLTWEQTDALASQIVPEVKLPKGSIVSPEETAALRRSTFGLIDRAATIAEDMSTLRRLETALAKESPEALAAQQAILDKHGVSSVQALRLAEKAAIEEAVTAQKSLMGVRSEYGRGLNYLKSLQAPRSMDDADFLAAALKGGAVPEAAIAALRGAPDAMARYKFLRSLRKPGAQDYWKWYAMTAYLSGPVTQWRNLMGNAINFGAESVLVQPVAAGIDRLRNPNNRKVVLGENQAAAAGLSSGFLDGVGKALYYFRNGFTPQDASEMADLPPEVFGGALLPNVIGRSMGAVDQFFRTVGLHMELHRQATLQGVKQGLQGEALAQYVSEQIADPTITPEIHKRASRYAAELTFQEKNVDGPAGRIVGAVSGLGKGLDQMTEAVANKAWEAGLARMGKMGRATYGLMSFPPSVIVAPFINTPFNILKRASQYAVGLPAAVVADDRNAMLTAARGAIGLASVGAVYGLYQQGLVTGAAPTDAAERDAFYATKRPYAMRVGDEWVSYQNLGPLGMVLGAAANYFQTAEKLPAKDIPGAFGQMVASSAKTFMDASFLRGMYNILDTIANAERKGERFVAGVTTGLLPVAGAQRFVRDQMDGTLRDPNGMAEQFMAATPGLSDNVAPRLDFTGQEVQRPNPILPTDAKADPLREELLRLKLATDDGYLRDPLSAAKNLQNKLNTRLKKAGQPEREIPRDLLTRYGKKYGRVSASVLGQLIASEAYQRLDDQGKRQMVERAKDKITDTVDAAFIAQYLNAR